MLGIDFFFSIGIRQTFCAVVTGVQTFALPISERRQGRACRWGRSRLCFHLPLGIDPSIVCHPPPSALYSCARERARSAFALASPSRADNRDCSAVKRVWKRSEEHTSELQSLMRISYAVFCLKKTTNNTTKST